jgi:hypothetical protein
MAAHPFGYVQVFIYTANEVGNWRIPLDEEQAADAAGKPIGR